MLTIPERRAAAVRQDRMIQAAVPAFRKALATSKNAYIRKSAVAYMRTGHFKDDDFHVHELEVKNILKKYALKIGRVFNREILASIKSQRGGIERKAQSKFDYHLERWAEREAGRKAKMVAGTTRKDLNRIVQKAFKEEAPENIVIKQILSTRGYSNFRADAVARTETHNAAMFASKQTATEYAQDEGVVMKKIWSPTVDDRSREFHLAMENHEPIALDALFDVPSPDGGTDRMDRPGDQAAPAAQLISCRCILSLEVL